MKRILRAVICCALLVVCGFGGLNMPVYAAASATEQDVTAEGVGAIIDGDSARARDEALRDVYRRAAEQVGVAIDATTEMRDFQIFYDKVTSQSSGYVKSLQIQREWTTVDKLYHIQARAKVSTGAMKGDMQALATLIDMLGNPTIMVLTDERIGGRPLDMPCVETEIAKQLTEARYRLIDPAQSEITKNADMTRAAANGDLGAAVSLAQRFAADVLVIVKADATQTSSTDVGGMASSGAGALISMFTGGRVNVKPRVDANLVKASATVYLRVVSSRTASLLLTDTVSGSGSGGSLDMAGRGGLSAAGRDAGSKLVWAIPSLMSPGGGRIVQVFVKGATYTQIRSALAAMKTLRGVETVNLRSFDQGIGVIDLSTSSNTEDIAVRLEGMNPPMVVTSIASDKVEVQIER